MTFRVEKGKALPESLVQAESGWGASELRRTDRQTGCFSRDQGRVDSLVFREDRSRSCSFIEAGQ